jgi:hypothetical protein
MVLRIDLLPSEAGGAPRFQLCYSQIPARMQARSEASCKAELFTVHELWTCFDAHNPFSYLGLIPLPVE